MNKKRIKKFNVISKLLLALIIFNIISFSRPTLVSATTDSDTESYNLIQDEISVTNNEEAEKLESVELIANKSLGTNGSYLAKVEEEITFTATTSTTDALYEFYIKKGDDEWVRGTN